MYSLLLRICAVDRSSHTLFDEYHHLTESHHKALFVRATVAFARLRRRRATRAQVTLLQKRRHAYGSHSLHKLLLRHLDMASQQEIRRRSSAADRAPLTESVVTARATTTTFASSPDMPRSQLQPSPKFDTMPRACRDDTSADSDAMPPPPLPQSGEPSPTRHSRASSTVSRHRNRLSLTLPIALPTGDPSRVMESPVVPVSAIPTSIPASIPPTPMDTPSGVTSPSNANELIIAIAAQERRVLELREELNRAETDLAKLKKQWASEEVYRKRSDSQRAESTGSTVSSNDEDALVASRRSVELDRRKLLLQTQHSPAQSRRKVIRGGHARTLSLLSPVRTEGSFSIHEDIKPEAIPLPSIERRTAQLTNPNLAKRSSWQPRPPQQTPSVVGVPQFVEDFKIGLRAFVEDIRQITVGDEPVAGQPPRPAPPIGQRNSAINKDQSREQDATKPSNTPRAKTSTIPERSSAATSTATQVNKTPEPKARNGRMKHFSWTPLGFDSLDDTDWSNWDSPVSTKSARWSGSTMNSSSIDEIGSIPEKEDEDALKTTKKTTAGETPILSPTLEILPNVVNRLSPSNLKRTANNFMDEWEKSLMTPENRGKENSL